MNQTLEIAEKKLNRDVNVDLATGMAAAWLSFGECVRKIVMGIDGINVVKKDR